MDGVNEMTDLVIEIPTARFLREIANIEFGFEDRTKSFLKTVGCFDRIGGKFYWQSRNDRNPLSDLGLRRSKEQWEVFRIFIREIHKKIDLIPIIMEIPQWDATISRIAEDIGCKKNKTRFHFNSIIPFIFKKDPDIITQIIACYTNYIGCWDDAESIARELLSTSNELNSSDRLAYLYTCSGNVLASGGDLSCRSLYLKAQPLWEDPIQQFFTLLRSVVFEVKYNLDQREVVRSLEAALKFVKIYFQNNHSVQSFLTGLIYNLWALHNTKNTQFEEAEMYITKAFDLTNLDNDVDQYIDIDIVNRYRVQIYQNRALLAIQQNDLYCAVEFSRETVEFSRKHHLGSFDETLSVYGFVLTKAELWYEAVDVLTEAEKLISALAEPIRLKQTRKMLACAHDYVGNSEQSSRWLEVLNQ